MKVKGIIKTFTDDNKVYLKRIPIKLDEKRRVLTAIIDKQKLMFVFPIGVAIDRSILYSITDPQPISNPILGNRITEISNPTKRYLEVTVK